MSSSLFLRPRSGRGIPTCRLGVAALLCLSGAPALAQAPDMTIVPGIHPSHVEHVSQADLNTMNDSDPFAAFIFAFDAGDELFEVDFLAHDGGGANVGNGERTTRMPRADLTGPGEWASHVPPRATGPNGSSCISCHFQPVPDGAGGTSSNVHRDPFHTGMVSSMIQRNTPHLHGMGAIQRLAEEMTADLHRIRDDAFAEAVGTDAPVSAPLISKGVNFGLLRIRDGGTQFHLRLRGIDEDLVVKPFQWKGNFRTVREFNNDAMHNELGVQPREILMDGVDGDGDGVHTEATIGDMTALTLYLAAQPRPTTRVELGENGFGPVVPPDEVMLINDGEAVFNSIGCNECHVPEFNIHTPIFSEPSTNPNYRDDILPGKQVALDVGLDPADPLFFDLTKDQPDNQVLDEGGMLLEHVGALEVDPAGGAIIRPFGDMRRHFMGKALAESIDETGEGPAVFMTENLWGVGSTAPYLHDGRASTITEAILWHGGDALGPRLAFEALRDGEQRALVAFLENMVIFLPDEEE